MYYYDSVKLCSLLLLLSVAEEEEVTIKELLSDSDSEDLKSAILVL